MTELQSIAEKNRRATARGNYTRWLLKRFGSLDMMSVKEGEEKVHLRNIYIPLRIDKEDRADERMGEIDEVEKEELPGSDAREVIAEHRFVAISGRPGSGKTTLVQALIEELCSDKVSSFRTRLVGRKGILPVPLILRDYQDELETIRNLDELLDLWWEKAETEAQDKQKFLGAQLDIQRLKQSYSEEGDKIPLLLLFDGIDEVGGLEPRNKIVHLVDTAQRAGHRVVLTGRPSGYDGIKLARIMGPYLDPKTNRTGFRFGKFLLLHAQPFAWPQIQEFVKKFYLLHDEWKVERQRGIQDINKALQSRQYLLTLARRPIFLTLMALVHINDRRMPHGRADLYKRIIDLYLIRQAHQRRLKNTVKNTPMPHWEEQEVRRGLGYLAWLSQHKGATEKDAAEQDKRQVIWSRQEIADALRQLLKGETKDKKYHGRFRDIKPEQADELLNYYLNPAGLLIEPAEEQIQFAHLSFQEYLCAEYIHGRALAGGSRKFLDSIRDRLYKNLHLPGWDEVGLLLLTIHASQGAQTEPTAHLELLAELNPTDEAQAKLLINALTGKELEYQEDELPRWLSIAAATELISLQHNLPNPLAKVPAWIENELGLNLLKKLFAAGDQVDGLWDILVDATKEGQWDTLDQSDLVKVMNNDMREAWRGLHKQNRLGALMNLAVESNWIQPDPERPEWTPIADKELQQIIVDWVKKQKPILFQRDDDFLPKSSIIRWWLESVVPSQGVLWQTHLMKTPLDYCLLPGEFEGASPSLLFSVYPYESLPLNVRLALGLYQCQQLVDAFTLREYIYFQSIPLWPHVRSISRACSMTAGQSKVRMTTRWLLNVEQRYQGIFMKSFVSLVSQHFAEKEFFSSRLRKFLKHAGESGNKMSDQVAQEFEKFGYRYAAYDWFREQAESPDLMQRRGLRPGQPLPPELELFDDKGLLRSPLKRQAIVNLHNWLQDDQQILDWFFPEGLSEKWHKRLLEEMDILWKQPWSPRHAVAATLADWPEDLPERETTLAAIEQPLIDALLAAEAEGKVEEE